MRIDRGEDEIHRTRHKHRTVLKSSHDLQLG
jgi:hypothetical protein